MSPKMIFATFGGGSPRYRAMARRLARQASKSQMFDEIHAVSDKTIDRLLPGFSARHNDLIARSPRGYGYWIWKPLIIQELLRGPDGRVVTYLDAGCEFNSTPAALRRFAGYAERAQQLGIHAFEVAGPWSDLMYSKGDLLRHVGLSTANQESRQVEGTMLVTNARAPRDLVAEWVNLAVEDDYHFLDDSPSAGGESPQFIEHRHDQSIFSCLMKEGGIPAASNETQHGPDWIGSGHSYPIWTTRNRRILSIQNRGVLARAERRVAESRLSLKSGGIT